jgi:ketosteroid isomerase-like protein
VPTPTELAERHFETLFAHQDAWQELITDDLVWELPYAPSIGHPPQLKGRSQITGFLSDFMKLTQGFRFFDLNIKAFADGSGVVAEVRAEARILPTGRDYAPRYVVFLETSGGKITGIREYFNPATAAHALETPIVELAA